VPAPAERCGLEFGIASVRVGSEVDQPLGRRGFAPVRGLVEQSSRTIGSAGVWVGVDWHSALDELVEDVETFAHRRRSGGLGARSEGDRLELVAIEVPSAGRLGNVVDDGSGTCEQVDDFDVAELDGMGQSRAVRDGEAGGFEVGTSFDEGTRGGSAAPSGPSASPPAASSTAAISPDRSWSVSPWNRATPRYPRGESFVKHELTGSAANTGFCRNSRRRTCTSP